MIKVKDLRVNDNTEEGGKKDRREAADGLFTLDKREDKRLQLS